MIINAINTKQCQKTHFFICSGAYIYFERITAQEEICHGGGFQGGANIFWKFDPKLSNLVSSKNSSVMLFLDPLKTAQHSNSYLKLTNCAKRRIFSIFYEEIGGKKSWNGKVWKKMIIRVQFVCFIFFTIYWKIVPPLGDLFFKIYTPVDYLKTWSLMTIYKW